MKRSKFVVTLAPKSAKIVGGFASNGTIAPSRLADDLFNCSVPGPWLCCYMLRRFGWANSGSDPFKDLCTWTLTTPMEGLFLGVTPYLGGSNLHFSIRYTKSVGGELNRDPGREACLARRKKAVEEWWVSTGSKLYTIGTGKKDGDEDELVYTCVERDGQVYGLWRRKASHKGSNGVPKKDGFFTWWLGEFLKKNHPEVKIPKMTKREKKRTGTRFQIQARAALKATMRDLLRPTNVRDISFTPFGNIETDSIAVERCAKQKDVEYFEGAGYSAEAWFGRRRKSCDRGMG